MGTLRAFADPALAVSQEDATMANDNILDWNITLDQFTDQVREEVRKTADKYLDFLQKTVSSYPLGDTELGGKAKDCAEKNIAITRDYMHKLIRANNLLEAVPIQTEFMQSQLGSFGEQIKSLGEIYTKAAAEVLNAPLTRVA
jgi:hypothetical protein